MSLPLNTLHTWLSESCHLPLYDLIPLAGDASFRRYFRLRHSNGSFVLMDASSEKSSCIPFVAIAKEIRARGFCAPDIIASDLTQGLLLLSDMGDRQYLSELTADNAGQLYSAALRALGGMQSCRTVAGWTLPFFTAEFMRKELDLFCEWFLEKHLQLTFPVKMQQSLATCFDFLAASAAQQPQVFMHRDYHSANLMVLPNNDVGILDFQDAFIGPVTYDLVSLLRDCYIAWPESLVTHLATQYWERLALPQVSSETFLRWFDLMGLQRHLKALLTFSRKYRRDGDAKYLVHVPRTVNYITNISQRYSECQPLAQLFQMQVAEKCME